MQYKFHVFDPSAKEESFVEKEERQKRSHRESQQKYMNRKKDRQPIITVSESDLIPINQQSMLNKIQQQQVSSSKQAVELKFGNYVTTLLSSQSSLLSNSQSMNSKGLYKFTKTVNNLVATITGKPLVQVFQSVAESTEFREAAKGTKWQARDMFKSEVIGAECVVSNIEERNQKTAPLRFLGMNISAQQSNIENNIKCKQSRKEVTFNTTVPITKRFPQAWLETSLPVVIREYVDKEASVDQINFASLAELLAQQQELKYVTSSFYDCHHNFRNDLSSLLKGMYFYSKFPYFDPFDEIISKMVDDYGDDVPLDDPYWDVISAKIPITTTNKEIILAYYYYHKNNLSPTSLTCHRRLIEIPLPSGGVVKFPNDYSAGECKKDSHQYYIGEYKGVNTLKSYTSKELSQKLLDPMYVVIGSPIGFDVKCGKIVSKAKGRLIPLDQLLIQHLTNIERHQGFVDGVGMDQTIDICVSDWGDGTGLLGDSFVQYNIHIVFNSKYFKRNEENMDLVMKRLIIMMIFLNETKENIFVLEKLLAGEYFKVHDQEFELFSGRKFKIIPQYGIADGGMITKRCNHNCSGYLRCGFCNVLYSDNKQHLLEYESATPTTFDTKTLAKIVEKYKSNKLEELQGQCGLPGILLDDLSLSLQDKGLESYSKMLEFMHILKGNIARMLSCFRMEASFDDIKFSELADSEFRRHFTRRTLTAADFRNMLIQCDQFVLPFINDERDNAKTILFCLREVSRYFYNPNPTKEDRQTACIAIFRFGIAAASRWYQNIASDYFHKLWSHCGHLTKLDEFVPYFVIGERDESMFSSTKKQVKSVTSKRPEEVMVDIVACQNPKQTVKEQWSTRPIQPSSVERFLAKHPVPPINAELTEDIVQRYLSSFKHFSNLFGEYLPTPTSKGNVISYIEKEGNVLLPNTSLASGTVSITKKRVCLDCDIPLYKDEHCTTCKCHKCCDDEYCVFHRQTQVIATPNDATSTQTSQKKRKECTLEVVGVGSGNRIKKTKVGCSGVGCKKMAGVNCSTNMCKGCCTNPLCKEPRHRQFIKQSASQANGSQNQ